MHDKLFHNLTLLLLALCGVAVSCPAQQTSPSVLPGAVAVLNQVDTFTEEFKSALKRDLKGVRILALGESAHEDGATFAHKTNLVKFLHEEMGFNVLAFEFGFYGNWLTYEKIKSGVPVPEATKYSGWSKSSYGYPVYAYIAETAKSEIPLIYAGFDGEKVPDGIPNMQEFIENVRVSTHKVISEPERLAVDSLILAVYGRLGNPIKDQLSYGGRALAKGVLGSLADALSDQKSALISSLGPGRYTMYQLTLQSILMDEKSNYAGSFWNIVRDKHMAERISWLADSLYPGQKIILWGASGHFARNMVTIHRDLPPEDYGFYPFYQTGDWLYAMYGDAFYTMAFTTASGKRGLILPDDHQYKEYEELIDVGKPVPGSFEEVAFRTAIPTLYCNLRSARSGSLLDGEFIAYPFGHQQDRTVWKNVIDGFYFIREMYPDVYVQQR
jgi:erythromycin esterase